MPKDRTREVWSASITWFTGVFLFVIARRPLVVVAILIIQNRYEIASVVLPPRKDITILYVIK
jgi:hypothetical protein